MTTARKFKLNLNSKILNFETMHYITCTMNAQCNLHSVQIKTGHLHAGAKNLYIGVLQMNGIRMLTLEMGKN